MTVEQSVPDWGLIGEGAESLPRQDKKEVPGGGKAI